VTCSWCDVTVKLTLILTLYVHIKTVEQRTIIQQYGDWYTGRWWVGCYIWYSEEGPAVCGLAQSPPRCTKCNMPPINGQCTNFIVFDVSLLLENYVHRHDDEVFFSVARVATFVALCLWYHFVTTFVNFFIARQHDTDIVILSVCPSRSGILWKRFNIVIVSSPRGNAFILVSKASNIFAKFWRRNPCRSAKYRWGVKISRF